MNSELPVFYSPIHLFPIYWKLMEFDQFAFCLCVCFVRMILKILMVLGHQPLIAFTKPNLILVINVFLSKWK